jgi:uncharacterized protein YecT (DUF1311 family)
VTDAQLDSLLREGRRRGAAPGRTRAAPGGRPAAPAPPAAAPAGAARGSPGTSARPPSPGGGGRARASRAPAAAAPASPQGEPAATRVARDAADDPRCASAASADQRACLMAALERADVPLTRDYQTLIGELRRRAGGGREPPAVQSLRAEQRAWLDARDRQCRAALAGREGPLWGAARAPCFAALSERRAAELRARTARVARDDAGAAS